MEVLYYYIFDDKRNIKNCGFNFSSRYQFSFDPTTYYLRITEISGLPPRWFGSNITNITAIIGKNGTGKSNLIEALLKTLCHQGCGLLIWEDKGRLYRNKTPFKIDSNFKVTEWHFWGSPLDTSLDGAIKNTAVIFYSPTIDRDIYNNKEYYCEFRNISNAHFLRQKPVNNPQIPAYAQLPEVEYMQLIDTFRLILFFIYTQEKGIELPPDLRKPHYLKITFHLYDNNIPNDPLYLALTGTKTQSFESTLKYFILRQIFTDKTNIPSKWDTHTSIQNILAAYCHNPDFIRPNIFDELIQLHAMDKIKCDLTAQRPLKKGDDFCIEIGTNDLTLKFMTALFSFYFRQEPSYASFSTISFLPHIKNEFLSIKWDGMSSGEYAFFNFTARLYGELYKIEDEIYLTKENKIDLAYRSKIRTIILVLDEAELSFHPEWQQKFINLLRKSLQSIFYNINFQIILASHSPILISDIPKSNIIFLSKNKDEKCQVCNTVYQEETFGANIHTLFNDSFFLNGLPIGDFAKYKIQNLFDRLENNKECTTQILAEIKLIGEPILRNQLQKSFDNNLALIDIDKQIKFHEREIESLKQLKK